MIQLRSILDVADNTGARRAAMISKKGQITDTAGVGDIITVHIKQSATEATVKKGEVAKAVVADGAAVSETDVAAAVPTKVTKSTGAAKSQA